MVRSAHHFVFVALFYLIPVQSAPAQAQDFPGQPLSFWGEGNRTGCWSTAIVSRLGPIQVKSCAQAM